MKQISMTIIVLLACASSVLAQAGAVRVEIVPEQDQFLANEDLRVSVRVINFSGQTIRLGQDNWLSFVVDSGDGQVVMKTGNPPVAGEFTLTSSKTAVTRANLAPYFDLRKPGRYRVIAKVKLPQWKEEVVSPAKAFAITAGRTLQKFDFGVPLQDGETRAPEVRKYILQQAEYQKRNWLYLRITDGMESKTITVFRLAPTVSFSEPEAQVDRFSNLHELHQSGRSSFAYCMINPDGKILVRQTHDYHGESRPRLRAQEDGRIIVSGGIQRVTESDLPPSSELPNTVPSDNVVIPTQPDAKASPR